MNKLKMGTGVGRFSWAWHCHWQLCVLSMSWAGLFVLTISTGLNAPDLKLLDNSTNTTHFEGRLGVGFRFLGFLHYRSVCEHNFGMEEASVACRQLGYPYAVSHRSIFHSPILWRQAEVNCNGNEDRIFDCYYVLEKERACDSNNDVVIMCSNVKTSETLPDVVSPGQLRLAGGPDPYEGRLEVYVSETDGWATVCSQYWDFRKAELTCEELGYRPATSTRMTRYGAGTGPIAKCSTSSNRTQTLDCEIINPSDTCDHDMDVDVVCSGTKPGRQGEIRLVQGSTTSEGRVEVFDQNAWRTLCSDDWGIEEVQATCRQLGLPGPTSNTVPPGGLFGGNEAIEILQDSIACTGQERVLVDCTWTPRPTACNTGDASVQCGTRQPEELDLRMIGGKSSTEGKVEILVQGEWFPICGKDLGNPELTVICRQLGFMYAVGPIRLSTGFINKTVLIGRINCNGNEATVFDCFHSWGDSRCVFGVELLDIACTNIPTPSVQPTPAQGDVRLVGGPNPYEGRVEVYFSDDIGWAGVCHENTGFYLAEKICEKLHYRPVTSTSMMRYGVGTRPMAVCTDNVDTRNCQLIIENENATCDRTTNVDVTCDGMDAGSFGEIRLQDGTEPTEGRVEFFWLNKWMRACADGWGLKEAKSACYQLGMPVPDTVLQGRTFGGNVSGEFYPHKFKCAPTDYTLALVFCQNVKAGNTPCRTGDGSVRCGTWKDAKEGDIRLSGGREVSQGNVEVFHEGRWTIVCGFGFSTTGTVACHQLGYLGFKKTYSSASPIPHEQPYAFGLRSCSGRETSVLDCEGEFLAPYKHFGCQSPLGISCDPRTRVDVLEVRLVNGPYPNQGIVEVQYDGSWSLVCGGRWGWTEARVVCRQLGFASEAYTFKNTYYEVEELYGNRGSDYQLSGFACRGSEKSLADCFYQATSASWQDECRSSSKSMIAVVCNSDRYPSNDPRNAGKWPKKHTLNVIIVIGVIVWCSVAVIVVMVIYKRKNNRTALTNQSMPVPRHEMDQVAPASEPGGTSQT